MELEHTGQDSELLSLNWDHKPGFRTSWSSGSVCCSTEGIQQEAVIGKKRIYLQTYIFHKENVVSGKGIAASKYEVVSFMGWVISYTNKWDDYSNYFGEWGGDFQDLSHCPLFALLCLASGFPLPTTQENILHMDITRWSTPKSDWLYSLQPEMEKLYTVSKNKTVSWLWLRSWTRYCQIQT